MRRFKASHTSFRARMLGALIAAFTLIPSYALAANECVQFNGIPTYCTNGGFVAISQAMMRLALVFSDPSYRALFIGITILSITISGTMFYLRAISQGVKGSPIAWLIPIITGVIVYQAFFSHRHVNNMIVYDTVTLQHIEVADLPVGITTMLTSMNKIEQGIITIIDSNAALSTMGYQQSAGGLGWQIVAKMATEAPMNSNLKSSIDYFFKDCLAFEMARADSRISPSEISETATDLWGVYSKAGNPGAFTQTYLSSGGVVGTALRGVDCSEAVGTIILAMQSATGPVYDSVKTICESLSFDQNSIGRCQKLAQDYLFVATNKSFTGNDFAAQAALSNMTLAAVTNASTDPGVTAAILANKNAAASQMGMAASAQQWLPVARAIMTAIVIGMIPVLVIFITSPLVGTVIMTIMGFFIWLVSWGIADAIIQAAINDYSAYYFKEVASINNGFQFYLNFPNGATKMLTMFSYARTAGIMIASVITGLLTKFGGQAMSQLSGQMLGTFQGAGAQAGAASFTAEGRSQAISSGVQTAAAMANHAKFGLETEIGSATNLGASSIGAGAGFGSAQSAFDTSHLNSAVSVARAETQKKLLNGESGVVSQARRDATVETAQRSANTNREYALSGGTDEGVVDSAIDRAVNVDKSLADAKQYKKDAADYGYDSPFDFATHGAEASNFNIESGISKVGRTINESPFDKKGTADMKGALDSVPDVSLLKEGNLAIQQAQKDGKTAQAQFETQAYNNALGGSLKDATLAQEGKPITHEQWEHGDKNGLKLVEGAVMKSRVQHDGVMQQAEFTGEVGDNNKGDLARQAEAIAAENPHEAQFYTGIAKRLRSGNLNGATFSSVRDLKSGKGTLSVDESVKANQSVVDDRHGKKDTSRTTNNDDTETSRFLRDWTRTEKGAMEIKDPSTGKMVWTQGELFFNKKGQVVGGAYKNTTNGEFVSFFRGKDGNMKQGVAKGTLDAKGNFVVSDINTLSTMNTEEGGFAVNRVLATGGPHGTALYEKAQNGQDVRLAHTYTDDQVKELRTSIMGGVAFRDAEQDLKHISATQHASLVTGEVAQKGADLVAKTAGFKNGTRDLTGVAKREKEAEEAAREARRAARAVRGPSNPSPPAAPKTPPRGTSSKGTTTGRRGKR